MRSVLISIKPEWVAKILNGEKTVEIRKTAPKEWVDYLNGKTKDKPKPMIVDVYCTKGKPYLAYEKHAQKYVLCDTIEELGEYGNEVSPTENMCALQDWGVATNGHIVARFTLNKVEEIELPYTKFGCEEWVGCEEERTLQTKAMSQEELLKKGCLSEDEIYGYLNFKNKHYGYAWHISDLEIFGEPKEISEFMKTLDNFDGIDCWRCSKRHNCSFNKDKKCEKLKLTRAPQSWCYVE